MSSETTKGDAPESQAFELVASGNISGAITAVCSALKPEPALDCLAQLSTRAYRELKSVPAMTAIALEAVRFGLQCAAASADPETALRLRTRARSIAYNAGANCWPGWGDPVQITASDIADGLKLAQRNYDLVKDLALGGKAIGGAHWLLGALLLASGDSSAAAMRFQQAERAFNAAELPAHEAMAQGYAALVDKTLPDFQQRGTTSLSVVLDTLRAMESKEAHFFADQLAAADRIFSSLSNLRAKA